MLDFSQARQILPTVWHIPQAVIDLPALTQSYRSNNQAWSSQYPDRLLTPWGSNSIIDQFLHQVPALIYRLTGQSVKPQVGYASLDLSGSRIMMHRLHPDIRAYLQIFTGTAESDQLATVFCNDPQFNAIHAQDYADISEFDLEKLQYLNYETNHAWLMINEPRCFFGTQHRIPANQVRETVCLHFEHELPSGA